jgi:hypothetical protein
LSALGVDVDQKLLSIGSCQGAGAGAQAVDYFDR